MTSGNRSGEPIAWSRRRPRRASADHLPTPVLTHDRPIHARATIRSSGSSASAVLPIRRARGYAPLPISFRSTARAGPGRGRRTEEHLLPRHRRRGLGQPAHRRHGEPARPSRPSTASVDHCRALPDRAGDCRRRRPPRLPHLAAGPEPDHRGLVARSPAPPRPRRLGHGRARLDPSEPVLGFAFDGTGYGADGTIWGGEVLVADGGGYERVGHLRTVPLPGGDARHRAAVPGGPRPLLRAGIDWAATWRPVGAVDADRAAPCCARQLEAGSTRRADDQHGPAVRRGGLPARARHSRSATRRQAAIELEFARPPIRAMATAVAYRLRPSAS